MKSLGNVAISACLGASALALMATGASARIVCNSDGDCWHATTTYEYPAAAGIVVHEDNWKWGPSEHFRWREHEGRGYWRGSTWTDF
jgi:hypothetical protein